MASVAHLAVLLRLVFLVLQRNFDITYHALRCYINLAKLQNKKLQTS